MENMNEFMDTVKVKGGSLTITIPPACRDFSGVEAGDFVKVIFKIVKKKEE